MSPANHTFCIHFGKQTFAFVCNSLCEWKSTLAKQTTGPEQWLAGHFQLRSIKRLLVCRTPFSPLLSSSSSSSTSSSFSFWSFQRDCTFVRLLALEHRSCPIAMANRTMLVFTMTASSGLVNVFDCEFVARRSAQLVSQFHSINDRLSKQTSINTHSLSTFHFLSFLNLTLFTWTEALFLKKKGERTKNSRASVPV